MNAALRAAVIAEWRGLPQKKARPDRFHTTGELLPKIMQRLGLRERLHETEVIDTWSKIVGEFIAAHSTPFACGTASCMSVCFNRQYTTDSNKSKSPKPCEKWFEASFPVLQCYTSMSSLDVFRL